MRKSKTGMHHQISLAWIASIKRSGDGRLNKSAREAVEQWTTDEKDMTEFKN